MNNKLISDRVEALRAWMREEELDAFVVPTGDPHLSEYVPAHWKTVWSSRDGQQYLTMIMTLNC